MSSEQETPTTELHSAPAADIEDVRVENEMSQAYVDYGMSVIAGRALPDVRDGLKPVHRRILHAMDEEGVSAGGSHHKSANIVGATMGNFHPHGDSAIYDTLVGMAQPFSMRYPLVDGQGNFGSLDGDSAAAMRYTEARMDSFGEEMLRDINEDTVDWQSNYDDRLEEPTVLPAAVPNLLVNGSTGIAVGMSTKIPPHNLNEIIDALCELIDRPAATISELMDHVKGPDFPTGATIVGRGGIKSAYTTGRGRVRIRADYRLEPDNDQIIITEIPYQKKKEKLVRDIADKIKEERIDGVRDLRDESDQSGVRIVVELKRDAIIEVVENQLKEEVLEQTFGVINLALVDGQPKVLTLKEMLQHYIDHRVDVVTRRSAYRLQEAQDHAHILEGRLVAVENAEEIVELIRESTNRDAAIENLRVAFSFSEAQATHVVRMQLGSLTSMETEEIETDYEETQVKIERLETILGDDAELMALITDELREMQDTYGDDRRTDIITDDGGVENEDLIPEESITVVMTDAGYLKRMPANTFSAQSRGGKGVIGMDVRDGDTVNSVFTASTHDRFLAFTNHGNVHALKGYQIPDAGRSARGTAAVNILNLSDNEQLVSLLPEANLDHDTDDSCLVTFTKNGCVKRTTMSAYEQINAGGKRALELAHADELVDAEHTDGTCDIIISTNAGMSIRFSETEVRKTGRVTKGVNGIQLTGDDTVAGATTISAGDTTESLLTITENGYGKRTAYDSYKKQSRYGKGLIDIKTGDRNGAVSQVTTAGLEDDVLLASTDGQIMRLHAEDISEIGRNTKGVNVMDLEDGDTVASFTVFTTP
jgi:DNA gyrase subunit A